MALVGARAVMAATECGVFPALAEGPLMAAEIAQACGLEPRAAEALFGALVSIGYLRYAGARFALTPKSRKWLAQPEAWSLRDYLPHVRDVWEIMGCLEGFLRTGTALDIHSGQSVGAWERYQKAMRSLAALSASEVARRLRLPRGPRRILDIGGAHGYYAVALCRTHPDAIATILDLPQAVAHAAPILATEGMGKRVRHQEGDALTEDLGEGRYDLVLISNLVHHFTAGQNRDLVARAARALRPGGRLAIQELIRPQTPNSGQATGQLLNLFFALTSTAGTWTVAEIQSWLRSAGLSIKRPVLLRSIPGAAQVIGIHQTP